MADVALAALS